MSAPLRVEANVHFELDEAVAVPNHKGDVFQASVVHWQHYVTSEVDFTTVTAFNAENTNNTTWYVGAESWHDEVPAWVPEPPTGWDAAVIAFSDSLAAVTS